MPDVVHTTPAQPPPHPAAVRPEGDGRAEDAADSIGAVTEPTAERVRSSPMFAELAIAAALVARGARARRRPRARCSRAGSPPTSGCDRLPVAANSDRIIASIGARRPAEGGLRLGQVPGQAGSGSRSTWSSKQDAALEGALRLRRRVRPRPLSDPAAASTSRAAATATRCCSTSDRCRLYELFALRAQRRAAGTPAPARRGTCARRSCARRAGPPPTPPACRSCRCSPATTRSGAASIDHALRVTVQRTPERVRLPGPPLRLRRRRPRAAADGRAAAAEGERRRLRPTRARRASSLRALKTYGLIVADNGSDWFISGAPDAGWDNDQLHALGGIKGATSRSWTQGSGNHTIRYETVAFRISDEYRRGS